MKRLRELNLNRYFTGPYLRWWYGALYVVIGFMLLSAWNDRSVESYRVLVFDSQGQMVQTRTLSANELSIAIREHPPTIAFRPVKKLPL